LDRVRASRKSVVNGPNAIASARRDVVRCFELGVGQSAKLPPPTRTVYKCVINGNSTFSDEPCLCAERFEVQPNRGVSRMTATTRKGVDVRREEMNEAFAEPIRPLTGKNANP
jgi:hypothetical protein